MRLLEKFVRSYRDAVQHARNDLHRPNLVPQTGLGNRFIFPQSRLRPKRLENAKLCSFLGAFDIQQKGYSCQSNGRNKQSAYS
jgi:hypothetical protein